MLGHFLIDYLTEASQPPNLTSPKPIRTRVASTGTTQATKKQYKQFAYKPLKHTNHQIRVLDIEWHGGDSTSPIRVNLTPISLDEDEVPYDALSYCWGGYDNNREIICDGVKFRVTDNLFDALWQIREFAPATPIWVDAICINQAEATWLQPKKSKVPVDREEKPTQLRLMARIYGQSRQTVIWLGKADHETKTVCDFIEQLEEVDTATRSLSRRGESVARLPLPLGSQRAHISGRLWIDFSVATGLPGYGFGRRWQLGTAREKPACLSVTIPSAGDGWHSSR